MRNFSLKFPCTTRVLQGALWSPSKQGLPSTPEGIVRTRTQEFEARGQVRFILGWVEGHRLGALPLPLTKVSGHLITLDAAAQQCLSVC